MAIVSARANCEEPHGPIGILILVTQVRFSAFVPELTSASPTSSFSAT